jgi:shikimate dehydrogenase
MRGSGKTAVGKLLAASLGMTLIDSDDIITDTAGMSVTEIVSRQGWEEFRNIEAGIIAEIAGRSHYVIATGGGIVERPANIDALRRTGKLVWLKADATTLLARISNDDNRPSLTGQPPANDMAITLKKRRPIYESAADFTVDTTDASPTEVTQIIADTIIRELAVGGTTLCGVVGHPVIHSLSPLIHNRAFAKLGLDYFYTATDTTNIEAALDDMRSRNIRGLSVTIPHKETVLEFLDSISDNARNIGAVNTIVNENGTLRGYNTDGLAALRAIGEVTPVKGRKAVIAGAGGAGAAIVYELIEAGAEVVIIDLYPERAAALAKRLGATAGLGMDAAAMISKSDIFINTTPVGMWPDTEAMVVPKAVLQDNLTVFDAVYNPFDTMLLKKAREAGAAVVYGYKMFLYQAVAQFKLFTGKEAPLAAMETALIEALGGKLIA